MEGRGLAARANWEIYRSVSCTASGLAAFASLNDVYLLNTENHKYAGTLHVPDAGDIGCIAFSPDGSGLVAAYGKTIRIWDVENKKVIFTRKVHCNSISSVDWSKNGDKILSGDESGEIVGILFSATTSWESFSPSPGNPVTVVSCSRNSNQHVAVGFEDGLILILDHTRRGMVVQNFNKHNERICEICWAPGIFAWKDLVIASVSRKGHIHVWNSEDGEILTEYRASSTSFSELTMLWPEHNPKTLLLGFSDGSIWRVPFTEDYSLSPRNKRYIKGRCNPKFVHHLKVTSMCCYKNIVISVSKDQYVAASNMTRLRCFRMYGCLGGTANSLDTSPLRPEVLVAAGDGKLKFWSTTSDKVFSKVPQKETVITCLKHHPEKPEWIGFGTQDGEIGIINSARNGFSSTFLTCLHKKPITSIDWGPPCGQNMERQNGYFLFSCADGRILMNDPKHSWKLSVDLDHLISPSTDRQWHFRLCMSWKKDSQILAVGNSLRSIEIYKAPRLTLLGVIAHSEVPVILSWHPTFIPGTVKTSRYDMYLAVASEEHSVHVYDSSQLNLPKFPSRRSSNIIYSSEKIFVTQHEDKVSSIDWSPHQEGLILSSSYDSTVQVWDLTEGLQIQTPMSHKGKVLSAKWCHFKKGTIYSGGEDCTVQTCHLAVGGGVEDEPSCELEDEEPESFVFQGEEELSPESDHSTSQQTVPEPEYVHKLKRATRAVPSCNQISASMTESSSFGNEFSISQRCVSSKYSYSPNLLRIQITKRIKTDGESADRISKKRKAENEDLQAKKIPERRISFHQ